MRGMKLVFVLSLAAVLALPAMAAGPGSPPAAGATESTMESTTSSTVVTMESDPLIMSTVTQYYGFDPATVCSLQAKGYTTSDFAALGNLCMRVGKPMSEFVALRDQGMSWSQIATRYNVSMSDMNTPMPMAVMMSPEVDAYNRAFAIQYFGLSDSQITSFRAQGMTWGEVYMTANLAQRIGRPATEIASLRQQGISWNDIGSRYNIAMTDISKPFAPAPARVAGVTAQVGMVSRPLPIYGKGGSIVLTEQDAQFYMRAGHSWKDIAKAAGIARETGVPVYDLLRMSINRSWTELARTYGLNPDMVLDTDYYPFSKEKMPMEKTPSEKPYSFGHPY